MLASTFSTPHLCSVLPAPAPRQWILLIMDHRRRRGREKTKVRERSLERECQNRQTELPKAAILN